MRNCTQSRPADHNGVSHFCIAISYICVSALKHFVFCHICGLNLQNSHWIFGSMGWVNLEHLSHVMMYICNLYVMDCRRALLVTC